MSGQFEPELASFFEVKEPNNYPSLCESRKYGKADWTISELMDDFGEGDQRPPSMFLDASNGPVKNQMITTIQLTMPTGDEKKELFKIKDDDANKKKQMNHVANCILQFYNRKPLSDNELTLVTIDATSGQLPAIFQKFDGNIMTNANALTICDSASGGVDESKNKYDGLILNKKLMKWFENHYCPKNIRKKYINDPKKISNKIINTILDFFDSP